MKTGLTLQRFGRINNKWITDGMSEILSTFLLALFVYASGAQYILTDGAASSVPGRALASGVGLTLAVYCGFNASGGCLNPCITLMFCMTGKLPWKRYPVFVVCQMVGAFVAASLTFLVYQDLITKYDGGNRMVYGNRSTAHIFTSFPVEGISTRTGFIDVAVGCGLLTGTTCMLVDPFNAKVQSGLIPLALTFLLYGIIMSFGVNTGAPLNCTIDGIGRVFAYVVGYGTEVFTRGNYWFWVPPVACFTGTIVFVSVYQLMVGNHLPGQGVIMDDVTIDVTETHDAANSILEKEGSFCDSGSEKLTNVNEQLKNSIQPKIEICWDNAAFNHAM